MVMKKFLDLGWLNESEIFYKGKIYWCEGYYDKKGIRHFSLESGWPKLKTGNTISPLWIAKGILPDMTTRFI